MEPLISWKDGTQTASYEGPDYVTMHPSGAWGISWFSSAECEKITLSGGTLKTEPLVFKEVDLIQHLLIDENHIYVCGSAVDESGHKVFIYDSNGALQMTLADSDGGGLGSITFITETANGNDLDLHIDVQDLFGEDLSLRSPNNIRRTYRNYIGNHELVGTNADLGVTINKTLVFRPYQDYHTHEEMLAAIEKSKEEAKTRSFSAAGNSWQECPRPGYEDGDREQGPSQH